MRKTMRTITALVVTTAFLSTSLTATRAFASRPDHDRGSSNGKDHNDGRGDGKQHDRSRDHDRGSSNGKDHNRGSSYGKHHDRNRDHDRGSPYGKAHDRGHDRRDFDDDSDSGRSFGRHTSGHGGSYGQHRGDDSEHRYARSYGHNKPSHRWRGKSAHVGPTRHYRGSSGGHHGWKPVPRSRYYRGVHVTRHYGHRYPGYAYFHTDDDAFAWLAFTAIALKVLDNVNEEQQRKHEAAQVRAASARVGETIVWNDGNASGSVTTTRDGRTTSGRYCREFHHKIKIGDRVEEAYGTACQQPDGSWEIVTPVY